MLTTIIRRAGAAVALTSFAVLAACSGSGTSSVPARSTKANVLEVRTAGHSWLFPASATFTVGGSTLTVNNNGHVRVYSGATAGYITIPGSTLKTPSVSGSGAAPRSPQCTDQQLSRGRHVLDDPSCDSTATTTTSGNVFGFYADGGGDTSISISMDFTIPDSGTASVNMVASDGSNVYQFDVYGAPGSTYGVTMSTGSSSLTSASGTVSSGGQIIGTGSWTCGC